MSKPPWPARVARPATTVWLVLKTLIQTAAFWFLFLCVLPWLITGAEGRLGLPQFRGVVPLSACVLLFAAGGLLGLWSAWSMTTIGRGTPFPFDCAPRLVIVGPYAYVRNPMAIGGLTQGLAVALWLGSPSVVAYVLVGVLLWDRVVRRWEEYDLAERFGASFESYRAEVRCWWPRWRAYQSCALSIESGADFSR